MNKGCNSKLVWTTMQSIAVLFLLNLLLRVFGDNNVSRTLTVGNWTLRLNPGGNFLVPEALKSEWVSLNGTVEHRVLHHCDYRLGVVEGLEVASRAVVSVCDNSVLGYVETEGLLFFIQDNNSVSYDTANTIIRKKRNDHVEFYPSQETWMYNLTGDTIDLDTKDGMRSSHDFNVVEEDPKSTKKVSKFSEWGPEKFTDDEELGYFYDTAWTAELPITRKKSHSPLQPRWLEIAIAVDHTLIKFHGRDKVEQYVLALMNIVNTIYEDATLGANLKLAVTRLLLYEHKKQSVIRSGDAKKSLENVNNWNARLHKSLRPGEPRHDVAIWLTRSDIGGPSGYAPVAGVCNPKRSCALNRDEGLSSAFIIAHEMAHILGLNHDGNKRDGNNCSDESENGSVMASLVSATFHRFSWSECSRNEFRSTVKKWSCLWNPPNFKIEILLNDTLQNAFTMDEQCRMEFGEGFGLCRAFDIVEPCSHLWCGHVKSPLVCKTKKGSPLEGTRCGLNKWCLNGYCDDIAPTNGDNKQAPITLNPRSGGWSTWSPWGPCSRSCGTGVQFRNRKCNNPEPQHGGHECVGVGEKWRVCKRQSCPEPWGDMRAEQCKRLPKLLDLSDDSKVSHLTWLPHESSDLNKKCKLICVSNGTEELFESNENLIDGTPCSYENSDNICIQGVCQLVGCDGKLFSNMKRDLCGVCGGNNSDCSTVKSMAHRRLKRELSRISAISRLATKISVEINVTSDDTTNPEVAFILKNRKKKHYSMTIPNTSIIIEGTRFHYEKESNRHKIWAPGPVLAEMVILVYAPTSKITKGLNISVLSEYVINKKVSVASDRYKWLPGGWGPCSASCNGGRRQKTTACWDTLNQRLVRRKHCSLMTKPVLKTEKCNDFECNFQWVTGKWEPCSTTCGLYGTQERELYCIPQILLSKVEINGIVIDDPWKYMVNPQKCVGVSPISSRPCNRKQCPSYWTYGEWSLCSDSCDFSYRLSHCPQPSHDEHFYTCGEGPPHTQKRSCYGGDSHWANHLCKGKKNKPACVRDKSEYCSLAVLSKYCKIGGFRKLCCKSC